MCAEKSAYYVMNPEEHRVPEDIQSFVNTFEPIYFLPKSKDEANYQYLFSISQSQRWIEDEMEKLLWDKTYTWKPSDVIHLLAWKMGRINHNDSKNEYIYVGNDEKDAEQRIAWSKDAEQRIAWSDGTNDKHPYLRATNRSGNIEFIDNLVSNILKYRDCYSKYEKHKDGFVVCPREMLKDLRKILQIESPKAKTIKGIGSVYLITILYFVSSGKYPIYDRFAAMALQALLCGKKPGTKIQIRDLPDKTSDSFLNMLDDPNSAYKEYINSLEIVSKMYYDGKKDGYQIDRRLDRALWVYGHLFG